MLDYKEHRQLAVWNEWESWVEVCIMSHRNYAAVVADSSKKICPVCAERSYSPGGIHPQCAVVQADATRTKKIKAAPKSAPKSSRWSPKKMCPKCRTELHVRRKKCDCGHDF